MDPFSKLPRELRIQVLINVKTGKDLVSLRHASPSIYQQFRSSRQMVVKGFTGLEGSLLRMATAIVTFPDLPDKATKDHYLAAEAHLQRWSANELPDSARNIFTLGAIKSYMLRLEVYMADYVTKATSIYLPFAYLALSNVTKRFPNPPGSYDYPTDKPHEPARLDRGCTLKDCASRN